MEGSHGGDKRQGLCLGSALSAVKACIRDSVVIQRVVNPSSVAVMDTALALLLAHTELNCVQRQCRSGLAGRLRSNWSRKLAGQ